MAEGKKIKKILRVGKEYYSSLSSFVERPVPTEKEVSSFERAVNREARNQEIDTNLSEIYKDKEGELVNVKKLKVKRRQLFVIRAFKKLLFTCLLVGVAYFAYSYFFDGSNDSSSLELKIVAPEKVLAGQDFSYQIEYRNPSKFTLSDLYLEIQYPENFILLSTSITPTSGNYGWNLPNLNAGEKGSFTISGKIINQEESANVISGRLSYMPLNYSSQFKKEASANTVVSGPGFRVDLEYNKTAFLGQDNSLTLIISDLQENYLGDFNLTFSLPEEADAAPLAISDQAQETEATTTKLAITKSGGSSWQISGLRPELGRQEIPLSYKLKVPVDNPEVKVRLEKKLEDGQSYIFWEKTFIPELVKSDLNLTLFVNGSKNDTAVNFSQDLNYSLSYSNKGDNVFKDLVIMAVLAGDFLDAQSVRAEKNGAISGKTIIWTKNEIPELAEVRPGAEGEINFSAKVLSFSESDLGKDLTITSYGQYGVNNQTVKGGDNKSNTIISLINSDLSLNEQIRYFNEDNQPVGYGPLPPKVGQKSGFRVYWSVRNNLHELNETRAVFTLPANVNYDERSSTNVGSLLYDAATRQVIWQIGRLPVSVYRADAEFSISLTPSESDYNKILVLSPGSSIEAMDIETKSLIYKKTGAKTTKLEDDEIAGLNNSGSVGQ